MLSQTFQAVTHTQSDARLPQKSVSFVFRNSTSKNYQGIYDRLFEKQGLQEVFTSTFPIESQDGGMSLEYEFYMLDFENIKYWPVKPALFSIGGKSPYWRMEILFKKSKSAPRM